MDVDTDNPEPEPLQEMPRKVDYGEELIDERSYQDDLNQWKELKHDHANQVREHKKQTRELNSKLEQIKNNLCSLT